MNKFLTALLYRLQHLLRQNSDAIANSIVLEQGKTLAGMVFFNGF
jgi:acyl-CoA reductase-like NAD-dependent aldehyde dehydrogenase